MKRKGRWVVEQDFHGQCYMVFLPSSPVSLTELYSFWYGLKDLFTLHKLADKLSLTIKTDGVKSIEGTWICTATRGRMG